jgi:glycosyltransferase involved in cell wall biosynthesis
MKILLANKFFYKKGGSEQVFFQERDYLYRRGVHIVDFSMRDHRNLPSEHSEFFVDSIDYNDHSGIISKILNGFKFIHSGEGVRNIKRLVKKENPDIAHLHNIYHQLTPSIITTLKKYGVKIIMTLHDYKLICPIYIMRNVNQVCGACEGKHFWKVFSQHCKGAPVQEFLLMMEAYWHKWRKTYDNVDVFLAPSRFMADTISNRIEPGKITVLPNGINPNRFIPSYTDEGYCLYIGRISREKGIHTMLEAHQLVSKTTMLKIAGTGDDTEELKSQFPEAQFLGYQSGKILNNTIANASFIIAPSEWNENCSMSILEAMAAGKPVIGARIGGIPEQIIDGETGFLFEPKNYEELAYKMRLLSDNPGLRSKMGAAGRRRLEEHYSEAAHFSKLMEIYTQLLSTD